MFHVERRNFLRTLVGGVAVATAVRTWPFRVYSFPSDPLIFQHLQFEIARIDALNRTIEIANIHQSQYNWKNLSRSSEPLRVGVT
jgi:hypothetical protein